jgi:hypothetical protein
MVNEGKRQTAEGRSPRAVYFFCLLLSAFCLWMCGPSNPNEPRVSKEPTSVRGWILDQEGAIKAPTPDLDVARRMQLYQTTNVWVDNAPYVSGGVAENGSFILLDVPPGNITVTFSAPGSPNARLVLQNIPGNADVFVPALILKRDSVGLGDPKGVKVRLAAQIAHPTPTNVKAIVAGLTVPVVNTPIAQMIDRHDYPEPPGTLHPIATVK